MGAVRYTFEQHVKGKAFMRSCSAEQLVLYSAEHEDKAVKLREERNAAARKAARMAKRKAKREREGEREAEASARPSARRSG